MMDLIFLITSETNNGEHGHGLIHTISSQGHPVIAIVSDFEKVPALHATFPTTVVFIVLDINRNHNNLTRILQALPEPNYIVKFPGLEYSFERCFGASYRERERDRSELKFNRIAKLDSDEPECRILVTVVDKRSGVKKTSGSVARNLTGFVTGAKKKVRSAVHTTDITPSERAPLIDQDEDTEDSSSQGLLSSLLSLCCPCFFSQSSSQQLDNYSFDNPGELRAQMRSEQISEMNEEFRKLHTEYDSQWSTTLEGLQRREGRRVEELTMNITEQKADEERQVNTLRDLQNGNTRDRLSGVLREDTLKKLEETKAKHAKKKVSYNASRAFQEGQARISNEVAIERASLRERHYNTVLEAQIGKLTEIKGKYERKSRLLYQRHFGECNA